jgi:hypothetical protein
VGAIDSPASSNGGDAEILSLGAELYMNDTNWKELFIFMAKGDILAYNEYMKSSLEKALTLFAYNVKKKSKDGSN